MSAGDQLPVIPLFEVRGSADKVSPWHIGATAVKIGTIGVVTVTVMVAVLAHCPTDVVKVYVVVVEVLIAGDQVPVIPLFEVRGRADKVLP